MKILRVNELEEAFASLEGDYDVRVPIALRDGTRTLGKVGDGSLALAGGAVPLKVTSLFFSQDEAILRSGRGGVKMTPAPPTPLMVVGLTAQDADCLAFIDRFFGETFRDNIYFNKRDGAVVMCVSGRCGEEGTFLKIAGCHCDLELICEGDRYLLAPYSDVGRSLAACFDGGEDVHEDALRALQQESDALPTRDADLIQSAAKLVQAGKVPEEFWQSVADRCIMCTSCNLACPTCTCFDVYDRKADGAVERSRMWDSCQLDGFMREASGHNPMGTESARTRRRIHHKLAADPMRWNTVTCFVCGRCDKVCPTGIGILGVCREMLSAYGDQQGV